MIIRLLICLAVVLTAGCVAHAVPSAQVISSAVSLSTYAHSISKGADAHSQIYEACYGITPESSVTAELVNVGDNAGDTNIGSLYVQRPLQIKGLSQIQLAGYGGVSWLTVKDRFGEKSDSTGLTFGIIADMPLRPDLTLYSRAGVAFMDENVWTLDAGLRYSLPGGWFLSAGYRSYDVGGSSISGFLIGATYRVHL